MSCEQCWAYPCTCGKQYEHMSTDDLKQIKANLSVSNNKSLWTALTVMIAEREEIDRSWEGPGNR